MNDNEDEGINGIDFYKNKEKQVMEEALKLAKEYGFQTVKKLGMYEGYTVYQPDFTDGEDHVIGLPHYIFEKNGKYEIQVDDYSFKITNHFYPDDEEEE